MGLLNIERALISVYDKTGIVELAKFLQGQGVEILSTGGTYDTLSKNGITCVAVEEFSGQKEFFGGRVKTLHPLIHGGILSKRDKESAELGIKTIDLVVVNLYPFEEVVKKGEKDLEKLIEMIDIGGPTMLRSAAKNHNHVCVVADSADYELVINEMTNGGIKEETRFNLALKVFARTAFYDSVIFNILSQYQNNYNNELNAFLNLPLSLAQEMRYGENPHQKAALYFSPDYPDNLLADFYIQGLLSGKELSYNNIADISAALRMLSDLADFSCVVIKHTNPCGAASRSNTHLSFQAAYEGDSVSIFGGVVAFKGSVTEDTAALLHDIFLEIIIAEDFSPEALRILKQKKNIRLLAYKNWQNRIFSDQSLDIKKVSGGFLVQHKDLINPQDEQLTTVTKQAPNAKQVEDLLFAQTMVKHVKSNAIVVVKDKMLLGVGSGQMNRVTAAKIALEWAGSKARGAVVGSDAFFPMDDTVRLCAAYGIEALIQPGGSIKDKDSIAACDELGLAMVFSGNRHFLH